MEFPHLMQLMEGNQFDTIYREHFSYFSSWPWNGFSRLTASRCSTSTRFPHTVGHCESTRGMRRIVHARSNSRSPSCERGKASELERLARLHGVRRTGQKHQAEAPGISDCRQTERQVHCRLWCARQRQYASELLRDSVRFPRLHGGPQPVPAPQFLPGTHITGFVRLNGSGRRVPITC